MREDREMGKIKIDDDGHEYMKNREDQVKINQYKSTKYLTTLINHAEAIEKRAGYIKITRYWKPNYELADLRRVDSNRY